MKSIDKVNVDTVMAKLAVISDYLRKYPSRCADANEKEFPDAYRAYEELVGSQHHRQNPAFAEVLRQCRLCDNPLIDFKYLLAQRGKQ